MDYKSTFKVLGEVYAERKRQTDKWGVQNHRPADYLMILGEEFGEVSRAALEHHFHGAALENYREELVQVAAVAVAMIECYDRQHS
jgi:NTP pyrophosphatase (non-canonical NTP hydrolase)